MATPKTRCKVVLAYARPQRVLHRVSGLVAPACSPTWCPPVACRVHGNMRSQIPGSVEGHVPNTCCESRTQVCCCPGTPRALCRQPHQRHCQEFRVWRWSCIQGAGVSRPRGARAFCARPKCRPKMMPLPWRQDVLYGGMVYYSSPHSTPCDTAHIVPLSAYRAHAGWERFERSTRCCPTR